MPSTRNRMVRWVATWPMSLSEKIRVQLTTLTLIEDCQGIEAMTLEAYVSVSTPHKENEELIAAIADRLALLTLEILPSHRRLTNGWVEYAIRNRGKKRRFTDAIDVVRFITQVAAAVDHPSVENLQHIIESREVYMVSDTEPTRWMDEAQWLVMMAKQKTQ